MRDAVSQVYILYKLDTHLATWDVSFSSFVFAKCGIFIFRLAECITFICCVVGCIGPRARAAYLIVFTNVHEEDETVQFGCNAGTCTWCPRNVLVYLYFCLPIDLTFGLHRYSHTYKQIRNVVQ